MNQIKNKKDYIYVGVQLVLFVCYILPVHILNVNLPDWLRILGLIMGVTGVTIGIFAFIQLNTNLSPFPTPVKNSELVTRGVFAYFRHPIYTALILGFFGYGVYKMSIFKIFVSFCLTGLLYFKSKYEEKLLLSRFPNYQSYKIKVGRFFPKI